MKWIVAGVVVFVGYLLVTGAVSVGVDGHAISEAAGNVVGLVARAIGGVANFVAGLAS